MLLVVGYNKIGQHLCVIEGVVAYFLNGGRNNHPGNRGRTRTVERPFTYFDRSFGEGYLGKITAAHKYARICRRFTVFYRKFGGSAFLKGYFFAVEVLERQGFYRSYRSGDNYFVGIAGIERLGAYCGHTFGKNYLFDLAVSSRIERHFAYLEISLTAFGVIVKDNLLYTRVISERIRRNLFNGVGYMNGMIVISRFVSLAGIAHGAKYEFGLRALRIQFVKYTAGNLKRLISGVYMNGGKQFRIGKHIFADFGYGRRYGKRVESLATAERAFTYRNKSFG